MDDLRSALLDELTATGQQPDSAIDIPRTALTLAALDDPATDRAACLHYLSDLAKRLSSRLTAGADSAGPAQALSDLLAGDEGFNGDALSYDAPENANLAAVIARRKGLPITLSILYAAVAQGAGLKVAILNVPLHVLIRVGDPAGGHLIDPFGAGRLLSARAADTMLGQLGAGQPIPRIRDVLPMTRRQALLRLQMNLALRAEAAGDHARCLEIAERMTRLAPADAESRWMQLRMEWHLDRLTAARDSLMTLRALVGSGTERSTIDDMLGRLGRQLN